MVHTASEALEMNDAGIRGDGHEERHVSAALRTDDPVHSLSDWSAAVRAACLQVELRLIQVNATSVHVSQHLLRKPVNKSAPVRYTWREHDGQDNAHLRTLSKQIVANRLRHD